MGPSGGGRGCSRAAYVPATAITYLYIFPYSTFRMLRNTCLYQINNSSQLGYPIAPLASKTWGASARGILKFSGGLQRNARAEDPDGTEWGGGAAELRMYLPPRLLTFISFYFLPFEFCATQIYIKQIIHPKTINSNQSLLPHRPVAPCGTPNWGTPSALGYRNWDTPSPHWRPKHGWRALGASWEVLGVSKRTRGWRIEMGPNVCVCVCVHVCVCMCVPVCVCVYVCVCV